MSSSRKKKSLYSRLSKSISGNKTSKKEASSKTPASTQRETFPLDIVADTQPENNQFHVLYPITDGLVGFQLALGYISFNERNNSISFGDQARLQREKNPHLKELSLFRRNAIQVINQFAMILTKAIENGEFKLIEDAGLNSHRSITLLQQIYKFPTATEVTDKLTPNEVAKIQNALYIFNQKYSKQDHLHNRANTDIGIIHAGIEKIKRTTGNQTLTRIASSPAAMQSNTPPSDLPPPLPPEALAEQTRLEKAKLTRNASSPAAMQASPPPPPPAPTFKKISGKLNIQKSNSSPSPRSVAGGDMMAELKAKQAARKARESDSNTTRPASTPTRKAPPRLAPARRLLPQPTTSAINFQIRGAASNNTKAMLTEINQLKQLNLDLRDEQDKLKEKLTHTETSLNSERTEHENQINALKKGHHDENNSSQEVINTLRNRIQFLEDTISNHVTAIDKLEKALEISEGIIEAGAQPLSKQALQINRLQKNTSTHKKQDSLFTLKKHIKSFRDSNGQNSVELHQSILDHYHLIKSPSLDDTQRKQQSTALLQFIHDWSDTKKTKEQAIKDYESAAYKSSLSKKILKGIATVICAAVGIIVGAAIGVGAGAIVGTLFGGPAGSAAGALIGMFTGAKTGLGIGITTAATVTGITLGAGSAYGLFKPNETQESCNELVNTAKLSLKNN